MKRDGFRSPEEDMVESFRLESESSQLQSDHCLSWEGTLLQLIETSRTKDGRAMLADLRIIPVLLALLKRFHTSLLVGQSSNSSPHVPSKFLTTLLLFLKLLRNLCAGDASNQDAFLVEEGPLVLVPIATALLSVCKPNRDSRISDDVSKVQISSLSSISKEISATGCPKDGDIYSRMRADLDVLGGNSSEVHSSARERVLYAGDISVSACFDSLRMLLQLLGNFSRGGDACEEAVWQEFYPNLFSELASLRSTQTSDVLCMVLYTCCKNSRQRCWQLCQGQGAVLMSLLLVSATENNPESQDAAQINWFELLVRHICLEESLFPLLFTNLGILPMRQELEFSKIHNEEYFCACQLWLKTCTFTSVQAGLLFAVLDSLTVDVENASTLKEDEKTGRSVGLNPYFSKDFMLFSVKILERAAFCVVGESDEDLVASVRPLHLGSPSVQIMGCSLHLWRILCTCESRSEQQVLLSQVLVQHGLLDLLLKMLEALGPPEAPGKKSVAHNHERDRTLSGPGAVPCTMCYQGYRRDIVAVIANASHQNRLVQDHVREMGKLLLVLQQSTVEMDNPFLREWGLWAMRNLLEGNILNQKEISSLELKEAVNLPELHNMGLRVEIDPNTRQPRLVNTGSRQ
ncbi:hypothetical protein Mapa_014392 [Marchantia paleacea]|nr:hypothetical protein Mapa_014392 [Marchantia paleacea]